MVGTADSVAGVSDINFRGKELVLPLERDEGGDSAREVKEGWMASCIAGSSISGVIFFRARGLG